MIRLYIDATDNLRLSVHTHPAQRVDRCAQFLDDKGKRHRRSDTNTVAGTNEGPINGPLSFCMCVYSAALPLGLASVPAGLLDGAKLSPNTPLMPLSKFTPTDSPMDLSAGI